MYCSFSTIQILVLLFVGTAWAESLGMLHNSNMSVRSEESIAAKLFNVPQSEIDALHALFDATDGPHWKWRNISFGIPWTFDSFVNPCQPILWQGIVCSPKPPLHIVSLILPGQDLRGTLPSELGNLTNLVDLLIEHSKELRGTLPESLGRLSELRRMVIGRNCIEGTVPQSLVNLNNLKSLGLFGNQLKGNFPEVICFMKNLTGIDIAQNNLNGSIPECLCNLTGLTEDLLIGGNILTGTIPSCLGNLPLHHDLDLSGNMLTGTIPSTLGNLTNVWYLVLSTNSLSGTVPTTFGNLSSVRSIVLYENKLSGYLPESMENLVHVRGLLLGDNHFSGTFPQFLCHLHNLVDISLQENKFSGTLPAAIFQLHQVEIFQVYNCYLTGSIPSELGKFSALQQLVLHSNGFTGTIPTSITNLTKLLSFEVSNNSLTGIIPTDLGQLKQLQALWLNDNILEGTIPTSISLLPAIEELYLSNNILDGPVEGIFDPLVHKRLEFVELSGNQLTGSLSQEIYALPALTTFAAVSNCLVTSLTNNICVCTSLVTLALDGLQTSSKCQVKLLHGLSASYAASQSIQNSIPACLFAMPNLSTLHLSGNGISGSLPANLSVSASLVDLSLSHNSLTGTIPAQIQDRQWYNLDLSFNRLTGVLIPRFAGQPLNYSQHSMFADIDDPEDQVAVALENNRLSGGIPGSLHALVNVSVLGSNMFSCNIATTDIPVHDRDKEKYSCGSDGFNVPYYVWLALVGSCVAIVLAGLRWGTSWNVELETIWTWLKAVDCTADVEDCTTRVPSLSPVLFTFDTTCKLTSTALGYVLLILLPFCITSSYYYGTFTYTYAWTASVAFLSGEVPTGLGMCLLLLLLVLLLVKTFHFHARKLKGAFAASTRWSQRSLALSTSAELHSWWHRRAVYALFMFISFSVVLGVNTLYVYVSLYSSRNILLLSQILLSFFKLFWNNNCTRYLMRWTDSLVNQGTESELFGRGQGLTFVLLFVNLVNNIAIPCLVVAFVSPNCYYNVFVAAPAVEATYRYEYCVAVFILTGNCVSAEYAIGRTSYKPPFAYSYQCSSSFITYYAPAFVILCTTVTVLTPLSEALVLWIYTRSASKSGDSLWNKRLLKFLPRIIRPLSNSQDVLPQRDPFSPIFDAKRSIVTLLTYLGILLTFGVVFPPLGVAIAVTIYVSAYLEKIKLGRFLTQAHELRVPVYSDILEAECKGVGGAEVLQMALRTICVFSCLFYTLFLFDTLGDAVGFDGAYWVLIVMPLMPVVIVLLGTAWQSWDELRNSPGTTNDVIMVELGVIHSPIAASSCKNSMKNEIVDSNP